MGKINQGILGGFSGRVAGVVGSSWKGIAVIKARPLSVANPKTAAQTAQRTKFKNVGEFGSSILSDIIKPLWDRFAQRASGYNDFVRTNIDLFAAALPSPMSSLIISTGKMASTAIDSSSGTNGGTNVALTWIDDSGSGLKLGTDVAYMVAVNEDTGEVVGGSDGSVRTDAGVAIDFVGAMTSGDVISTYLAFKRADGTVVSNTSYDQFTVA